MLESSGGFNEDTVTDDLDLSFRLLTHGALVGLLWDPPVQEEAVPGLHSCGNNGSAGRKADCSASLITGRC